MAAQRKQGRRRHLQVIRDSQDFAPTHLQVTQQIPGAEDDRPTAVAGHHNRTTGYSKPESLGAVGGGRKPADQIRRQTIELSTDADHDCRPPVPGNRVRLGAPDLRPPFDFLPQHLHGPLHRLGRAIRSHHDGALEIHAPSQSGPKQTEQSRANP
jgi:hypothetical protein